MYSSGVTDREVMRPRFGVRQCARALVLGLLITGVSSAAHGTHGHLPSPALLVVTALLVSAACLPFCRSGLHLRAVAVLLAAGEMVLHAWLAWFDLPSLGSPTTTTAHLLHGDHITATLAPRDFSALVPSPSMVAVHLLAAAVLAVVIVHADALAEQARGLLNVLLVPLGELPVIHARGRASSIRRGRVVLLTRFLLPDVRRRGPPAATALAV